MAHDSGRGPTAISLKVARFASSPSYYQAFGRAGAHPVAVGFSAEAWRPGAASVNSLPVIP